MQHAINTIIVETYAYIIHDGYINCCKSFNLLAPFGYCESGHFCDYFITVNIAKQFNIIVRFYLVN